MTLSDLERLDAKGQIFWQISTIMLVMLVWFDLDWLNLPRWYRWGGNMFLGGQRRPYRKGAGPKHFQFLGLHSIDAYALCRRTTKFHIVTNTERKLYLLPQRSPILGVPSIYTYTLWRRTTKGTESQRSPILEIPSCIYAHIFGHSYQIWRGNACREMRVSWGQPRLPSQ